MENIKTLAFFVHRKDSPYLKYALNQAAFFNKNVEIVLISDVKERYKGINQVDIGDYFDSAIKFKNIYQHLSVLPYDYEFFCLARWFIILEYLKKNSLISIPFFHFDSDVLVFTQLEHKIDQFKEYELTLSQNRCGHNSYFKNFNILENYCNYVLNTYQDTNKVNQLKSQYSLDLQLGKRASISDMTLFENFIKETNVVTFDSNTILTNKIFDNNMNLSEGFEFDGLTKKIKLINNKAFGWNKVENSAVEFETLHFQSIAKYWMHKFYVGSPKFYFSRLKAELKFIIFIKIGLKFQLRKKIKSILKK